MVAQTLLEIINSSPLSPEDKAHWKELLPKMTQEQKQHLEESLIRKTEITKSIESIEKALGVIDEAEREVDDDIALASAESERDELLDDIKGLEDAQPGLKSQAPAISAPSPKLDQPPATRKVDHNSQPGSNAETLSDDKKSQRLGLKHCVDN